MKNKKYIFSIIPLITSIPLLAQSQQHAKADSEVKLVAINENGVQSQGNYTNGNPAPLNSAPKTSLTNTPPTKISSDSKVSGYVPVNVINENKDKLQAEKEAKEAQKKLVAKRKAEALAKQKAEEQARAIEQARLEAQKQAEIQNKQENTKRELEEKQKEVSEEEKQETPTPQTQTTPKAEKQPNYSGELNMNQTSGLVDINTLANYMASTVGGDVAKWSYTIDRESGGDLTNWFNKSLGNPYTQGSTAYGVFQLLGHGEYYGMTLGEQIELAQEVYRTQGFRAWVASYNYG